MRFRRWAAFAALCSVLGLLFVLGPVNTDEARAYEAEEQRFLELINGYREANGLGPLALSETLSRAAERHSEDMQTHGFFSHTTEASSYYPVGSSFSDRLAREGYPTDNAYTAENIAWGYTTAEEVFKAWRISPSHNVNMLGKNYTAIGIGRVGTYWTTDFGSVVDPTPSVSEPQKPSGEAKTPVTKQPATPQTPGEPETVKPETTEQTPVTRPHANQSTVEPTSREQDAEASPDAEPDEEAALQTASFTPPTAEDPATEQSNAEETLTTETAQSSDGEQAIKKPANAKTNPQASQAASAEEDDQGSSTTEAGSVEDEATETTSTEVASAEVASAEVASAEAASAEAASAEAASEDAVRGADSDRDAPGKAPTPMKELPRTGGAPLPLLLGAILLLSTLLVNGIVRKRRTI